MYNNYTFNADVKILIIIKHIHITYTLKYNHYQFTYKKYKQDYKKDSNFIFLKMACIIKMGNPSTMQWAPKIPQKMTRDIDNDIFTGVYRRISKTHLAVAFGIFDSTLGFVDLFFVGINFLGNLDRIFLSSLFLIALFSLVEFELALSNP